tara:strand:+ start:2324 stop:2833 length:510 start_codon:yes stop_codon:yes gene_type:complete
MPTAFPVVILDQEHVLYECKAAQETRAQIESQRLAFQTEIDKHEKELRQEEEILKQLEASLSEKEFLKRRNAFDHRVADIHKKVALRRSQLERAFNKAREEIMNKINEIVARLSNEKKYALVMQKGAVIYSRKPLDITQDVLRELDNLLPTVIVESGNEIRTMTEENLK